MILVILFLVILIVLTALYVAAEFAAVGVRHTQIKSYADNGNALAKRLLPILEDARGLDRYIACCQVGITLTSLILGAIGQLSLGRFLGDMIISIFEITAVQAYSISALITLIILTVSQVIFGELIPKSLALQFPIKTALWTVIPMEWSLRLLGPFITFLNGSGNILLKCIGIQPATHSHIHSPQEIAMLIAESRDGGFLEEEEFKRLNQALTLSSKTAHQIMVPRQEIRAIDIDLPIEQIVKNLVDSPYTRLPVYRDTIDKVIGVVRVKDLVTKYSREETFSSIAELIAPVTLVPESISAERVLTLLREKGAHQALVVDEHGSLKGLITLEDVLSELFGEIADEFKVKGEANFEVLGQDRFRVPGKIRLDHLASKTGIDFQGDADTLSGYLVEKLGFLPKGKEILEVDGWRIRIEKVKNHVVSTAVIRKLKVADIISEAMSSDLQEKE